MLSPRPLLAGHDLAGFSCGHSALDDWLRNVALKAEGRTARTYVVLEGNSVVGYYCLATGAVSRTDAPRSVRQNAPDPIPVAIIGRLAVAESRARQGIGAGLLQDGLRRVLQISETIGCAAVVVHAIDAAAAAFYARYGFSAFPGTGPTLFLPIATLRAALQER